MYLCAYIYPSSCASVCVCVSWAYIYTCTCMRSTYVCILYAFCAYLCVYISWFVYVSCALCILGFSWWLLVVVCLLLWFYPQYWFIDLLIYWFIATLFYWFYWFLLVFIVFYWFSKTPKICLSLRFFVAYYTIMTFLFQKCEIREILSLIFCFGCKL